MKNTTIFFLFAFTLLFHMAQAQWQSMDGPQGRYVRSILCTDSLYYAATGGGVMVSSDRGINWEFRNNGLTSCDTKCLAAYNDTVRNFLKNMPSSFIHKTIDNDEQNICNCPQLP